MPLPKQPCVSARNISFSYQHLSVLENVNFEISSGEYVGIIGPNGGGKTTLLKLLLGILKPTCGVIRRDPHAVVGYVPQRIAGTQANFPATVEEIVRSGRTAQLGLFKRFSQEDRIAVDEAMEVLKITGLRKRLFGRLSGGQRQRVFIARALARSPQILILDEPTVGVDIEAQNNFYHFLEMLHAKHRLTIMLVSHDVDAIAGQVENVLCINRKILCHVSARDFVEQNYLQKMYGDHVKFIVHHNHD